MTVNITLHYSQFKYDWILALETFFFYIKSTLDLQLLHILSHKKDVAYVSNLNNKDFFYVNSWTFDFQMSLHRTQYLRLRLRSKVNEMKFHLTFQQSTMIMFLEKSKERIGITFLLATGFPRYSRGVAFLKISREYHNHGQ